MFKKAENTFLKKLYNMKIGNRVHLKINGEDEGVFIRVPSGWIYKYAIRNSCTSCFIPYTEDVRYWDMGLEINQCPLCNSTEVFLIESDSADGWYVECDECKASSAIRKDKTDAITTWNSIRRRK